MRSAGCLILAAFLSLGDAPAVAQDAVLSRSEIGPSGQAYLDAVRRSSIDPNVAYYDPTAPVPPLETAAQPEVRRASDEEETAEWSMADLPFALLAALIVAAVFYAFLRFGGGFLVALNPQSDNPVADIRNRRQAEKAATDAAPQSLRDILRIADRRAALVMLARNALREAVTANGLLLQQSWTSRDALRRLPATQTHLPALRDLVRASEGVQFGDRDVTEPEFALHVEQISPLFRKLPR